MTFSPSHQHRVRIEWIRLGRPTLVGLCVGAIAGLATITPAAGFIEPSGASLGNKSGDAEWLFFLNTQSLGSRSWSCIFFDFSDLKCWKSDEHKCMALRFFFCASYLFLAFCSLSLGVWERFSQSIYKNGHLLSLCIWQVFFCCMILTADFLDGVQGRASSKRRNHFCESALKTNRNSDSAPRSTCQLYLSLKSVIVDMKIHPLTIFISRFTACHYPNINHQSHLSHSSNHSSQIIHFINYQQKSTSWSLRSPWA